MKGDILQLVIATHNDMLMYQKELDEFEASTNRSTYNTFKLEDLRRKIKDCAFLLERYKPEVRKYKLNQLGI
jgi:hypothetical protein